MLLSLALFACSPGKVTLGEDVVGGEVVDANDTATDTGSADDSGSGGGNGDTGGGSGGGGGGGGGGQDTGGSGGQDTGNGGGGDTGVPPDPDAGEYRGTVDGALDYGRDEAGCEGETAFTVGDGALSGEANCVIREWGVAFEGTLAGTVVGGRVEGVWTVDVRGYAVPVEVSGTIARGTATLDLSANYDWFAFGGEIDARR
jgi:hypothetical protein